jgi:hypothetical protein
VWWFFRQFWGQSPLFALRLHRRKADTISRFKQLIGLSRQSGDAVDSTDGAMAMIELVVVVVMMKEGCGICKALGRNAGCSLESLRLWAKERGSPDRQIAGQRRGGF